MKLDTVIKYPLFSIIAILLILGALEVLFRIVYSPSDFTYEGIFEYDRDKVYTLKKNYDGNFADKEVRTNSSGYRDREIPVEKPKNGYRIVVIGDSVTFGHGVEGGETYPEVLEKLLQQTYTSRKVEVINTACPGNSTFQEYYDVKRSLVFNPDVIILQFLLNDVIEPYHVFRRFGGKGIDYHGVRDIPYFDYLLSQNSAFYLFLKEMMANIRSSGLDNDELAREAADREIYSSKNALLHPEIPEIAAAWEECRKWLNKIIELCRKRETDLIVICTPMRFQFKLDGDDYHFKAAEICEKQNVEYIDFFPLFKKRMLQEYYNAQNQAPVTAEMLMKEIYPRYFIDHDHFTIEGHQFAGKVLYELISEKIQPPES